MSQGIQKKDKFELMMSTGIWVWAWCTKWWSRANKIWPNKSYTWTIRSR